MNMKQHREDPHVGVWSTEDLIHDLGMHAPLMGPKINKRLSAQDRYCWFLDPCILLVHVCVTPRPAGRAWSKHMGGVQLNSYMYSCSSAATGRQAAPWSSLFEHAKIGREFVKLSHLTWWPYGCVESQIRTKTARHPIHRHACPDGYGSGAEMFICMTSYETCEKDDTGERERE
jgi:hypothetical protein